MDLGGTSIRAALVDAQRTVLASTRTETLPNARSIQNQIIGVVDALQSSLPGTSTRVANICIGFPGVVHPQTQTVRQAPNILGVEAHNLSQQLSSALGVPVYLENDVNLAALAEQDVRAGDGVGSLAMVAIGTGLGCGLILNGQLWQGHDGGAGELCSLALSHRTLTTLAELGIHQGFRQAEDLVSGKGLAQLYAQLLARNGRKPDPAQVIDFRQVQQLFALAEQGDPDARTCMDLAASEAAHAIEQLEHLLNSGLYVLAGGVGARPEFRARVNHALERAGLVVQASRFSGAGASPSYLDLETAGLAGAVLTALSRLHASHGQGAMAQPQTFV
jgi:glucokinase